MFWIVMLGSVFAQESPNLKRCSEMNGFVCSDDGVMVHPLSQDFGFEMSYIPPGEFFLGADDTDTESNNNEKPRHRKTIRYGMWVMRTEVTQELWESVMMNNPSYHKGKLKPVDSIRWCDAIVFANKLSELHNLPVAYDFGQMPIRTSFDSCNWTARSVKIIENSPGYRLLTEVEWEYMARGGTSTKYWSGDSECHLSSVDWYNQNATEMPQEIGQLPANPWGLYDIHGNVKEWVFDIYQHDSYTHEAPSASPGSGRVIRGGSWKTSSQESRVSHRYGSLPGRSGMDIGFRLGRAQFQALEIDELPLISHGSFSECEKIDPETHEVTKKIMKPSGVEMVLIPSGDFRMKSMSNVQVNISAPFWIMTKEVTNAKYREMNPEYRSSHDYCDDCPVGNISWLDAVKYANWMSVQEGLDSCYRISGNSEDVVWVDGFYCSGYRLPTQAEWEYAAYANVDTDFPGSDDMDEVAWHAGNSGGVPNPVGSKKPNAWGIYDMLGNLNEWCWDIDWNYEYTKQYRTENIPLVDPIGPESGRERVFRGLAYNIPVSFMSTEVLLAWPKTKRDSVLGFRLVKSAP